MNPNPYLVLSSLSFLAPSVVAYQTKNLDLAALYMMIWVISSTYHATKDPYLVYVDYLLAQVTHGITVYRILPGGYVTMPYYSCWFMYTFFIYCYGYMNQVLIWDPDLDKATPWHMSLHVSVGLMGSYTFYINSHVSTSRALNKTPFLMVREP